MNYQALVDFVPNRMRMSHIYHHSLHDPAELASLRKETIDVCLVTEQHGNAPKSRPYISLNASLMLLIQHVWNASAISTGLDRQKDRRETHITDMVDRVQSARKSTP